MGDPQVVQELKRDVFGRIELMEGPRGHAVRRVACGSRVPGSRLLARFFVRREARALDRLAGLAGVAARLEWADYAAAPSLDGRVPARASVLMRSWIAGVPLYLATELPEDFFERLGELAREVHARGVCHNDLHKEPNVLVDEDGYPGLVDFQLSSVHPRATRRFDVRVAEDLRHVAKHHRVYARGTGIDPGGGARIPKRRSLLARAWMAFGKPVYNFVTRRLMTYSDGEARRPSAGPWPRWTAPVGPRSGSSEDPD